MKKDQTITFAAIADTNATISSITPTASASSGLAVSYESNDTSVVSVSGSTLNINGGGYVTVTAKQLGNIAWRAATPVARTFFVKLVGKPMTLIFDGGGTMGANESFKPRISLKDGVTGKLIDRTKYTSLSVSFSITNSVSGTTNATLSSGTVNTGTGAGSFTLTVSVTDSNSVAAKRYVPKTASISITVDSSKSGQMIKVHDGGSGSFGLRDLPLSRKPIAIGKMFQATSGQDITFTISNDASKIINLTKSDLTGSDAMLVLNESGAAKFSGFGNNKEVSFDIVASQAGNGFLHAAQSVSRTVKLRSPPNPYFEEENRMRYDSVKADAMAKRMPAGVSGEKALALFNSDKFDSDGDGVSTCSNELSGETH